MKDGYIVTGSGNGVQIWRGADGIYTGTVAQVGLNPRCSAEERRALRNAIALAVSKLAAPAAPMRPRSKRKPQGAQP
jgi:hypothetical protein